MCLASVAIHCKHFRRRRRHGSDRPVYRLTTRRRSSRNSSNTCRATESCPSQPRSRWREVAGDGAGASAAVRRALHALLRDDFQAHCVRLTQSMLRFDHST